MYLNTKANVKKKTVKTLVPVPPQKLNQASAPASTSAPRKPSAPTHPSSAAAKASSNSSTSNSASLRAPSAKRKASSPATPYFSDDDDDSSSQSDNDSEARSRKRRKSSSNSSLEPEVRPPKRDIRRKGTDTSGAHRMMHGADLVASMPANKFLNAFPEDPEGAPSTIELQYPSNMPRERFTLVVPRESDEYPPLDDIITTIEQILRFYFPPEISEKLLDDSTGIPRRLKRAANPKAVSLANYKAAIAEFNDLVSGALADGTIARVLDEKGELTPSLVQRILDQVYSRTVSTHVRDLKRYKNGEDNVYGELLPPLVTQMFKQTGLHTGQVFVDLGSGVGNVVLQAALETGAASWGIEVMEHPAKAARTQREEFVQRVKTWGLTAGPVKLIEDDFTKNTDIDKVLKHANVVLINNQAFSPQLNGDLLYKFLDLEEGAKIVSLKSFVPANHRIARRNVHDVRNTLRVVRKDYYSGSVSWTDACGEYFVATKDSSALNRFLKQEKELVDALERMRRPAMIKGSIWTWYDDQMDKGQALKDKHKKELEEEARAKEERAKKRRTL